MSADEVVHKSKGYTPPAWESDADPDYYKHDGHECHNTVGWLQKRQKAQAARVAELKLHHVRLFETAGLRDLGADIHTSWCFVFDMAAVEETSGQRKIREAREKLDGTKLTTAEKKAKKAAEAATKVGKPWEEPEQRIPHDAWQFCHMLWKYDFHIEHAFSTLGDQLHILIGMPYQVLVSEGAAVQMKLRLETTLGTVAFSESLMPRYKVYADGTRFNSSLKQGLAMSRMRRMANVYPDAMVGFDADVITFYNKVFNKVVHNKPVRALALYNMFVANGVYRPHALPLFGKTVHRVSQIVLQNEYLIVYPQDDDDHDHEGIVQKVAAEENIVTYVDVEKCLLVLETWEKKNGDTEDFVGNMTTYLPLHYKPMRQTLTETWGNYGMLKKWKVMGRNPEYKSQVPYGSDSNPETSQYALLYQPIDAIRDYFGEEVAVYFAWLGLYTESLMYPAVLGVLVLIAQFVGYDGSIDDNVFTLPYTVGFAAWSILFLCAWKRRESELKFLWGSEGYEASERPLATFAGVFVVNHETGQEVRAAQLANHSKLPCCSVGLVLDWCWCCAGLRACQHVGEAGEAGSELDHQFDLHHGHCLRRCFGHLHQVVRLLGG